MIAFSSLGDVLRKLKQNWIWSLCASFCVPVELCIEFLFLAHFSDPYRVTLCDNAIFRHWD